MRRDGFIFKPSKSLTYRYGNPTRDFDRDGKPIDSSYCAIIRYTGQGSLSATPCLPGLSYGRTNMAYGIWRKRSTGRWFTVQIRPALSPAEYKAYEARGEEPPPETESKWFDTYWTCPVYWVENGRVYTSTHQRCSDPGGK